MNPYNIAILTGRMVKDPEIRYTRNEKAVASFTLAVNDGKDSSGKERTQYINCVAWGKTAEMIDKYFVRGYGLTVVGRNTVRSYEGDDGKKRYVSEVVVDAVGFPLNKPSASRDEEPAAADSFSDVADDDDLPF